MLKRILFGIVLIVFGLLTVSYAQKINYDKFDGAWAGNLELSGQAHTLIIQLEVKKGVITGGTCESPKEGGNALLENILVDENKIQFRIAGLQGAFEGVYKEDDKKIVGTLVVNQNRIPIVLTKDGIKYESYWEGALVTSTGELYLMVIKIYKTADGVLGAFHDCPTVNAKDIPVRNITLTEDYLKFEIPYLDAVYTGKINKLTMTANGIFAPLDGQNESVLDLKRVDKPTEMKMGR